MNHNSPILVAVRDATAALLDLTDPDKISNLSLDDFRKHLRLAQSESEQSTKKVSELKDSFVTKSIQPSSKLYKKLDTVREESPLNTAKLDPIEQASYYSHANKNNKQDTDESGGFFLTQLSSTDNSVYSESFEEDATSGKERSSAHNSPSPTSLNDLHPINNVSLSSKLDSVSAASACLERRTSTSNHQPQMSQHSKLYNKTKARHEHNAVVRTAIAELASSQYQSHVKKTKTHGRGRQNRSSSVISSKYSDTRSRSISNSPSRNMVSKQQRALLAKAATDHVAAAQLAEQLIDAARQQRYQVKPAKTRAKPKITNEEKERRQRIAAARQARITRLAQPSQARRQLALQQRKKLAEQESRKQWHKLRPGVLLSTKNVMNVSGGNAQRKEKIDGDHIQSTSVAAHKFSGRNSISTRSTTNAHLVNGRTKSKKQTLSSTSKQTNSPSPSRRLGHIPSWMRRRHAELKANKEKENDTRGRSVGPSISKRSNRSTSNSTRMSHRSNPSPTSFLSSRSTQGHVNPSPTNFSTSQSNKHRRMFGASRESFQRNKSGVHSPPTLRSTNQTNHTADPHKLSGIQSLSPHHPMDQTPIKTRQTTTSKMHHSYPRTLTTGDSLSRHASSSPVKQKTISRSTSKHSSFVQSLSTKKSKFVLNNAKPSFHVNHTEPSSTLSKNDKIHPCPTNTLASHLSSESVANETTYASDSFDSYSADSDFADSSDSTKSRSLEKVMKSTRKPHLGKPLDSAMSSNEKKDSHIQFQSPQKSSNKDVDSPEATLKESTAVTDTSTAILPPIKRSEDIPNSTLNDTRTSSNPPMEADESLPIIHHNSPIEQLTFAKRNNDIPAGESIMLSKSPTNAMTGTSLSQKNKEVSNANLKDQQLVYHSSGVDIDTKQSFQSDKLQQSLGRPLLSMSTNTFSSNLNSGSRLSSRPLQKEGQRVVEARSYEPVADEHAAQDESGILIKTPVGNEGDDGLADYSDYEQSFSDESLKNSPKLQDADWF